METSAQGFARLLTALEVLAAREELEVAAGDAAGLPLTQQRIAADMGGLVRLGAAAADAPARQRIAALSRRRERTQEAMAARADRIRGELSRVRVGRQQLALVAPAYGRRTNAMAPGARARWVQRA